MWVLRPREPRSRGLLYEEIVQFYGGLYIYGLCTRYSPRNHRPVTNHSGGRHFVGNDWPISLLETSDIIKALNPQPPLCAGDGCTFLGIHYAWHITAILCTCAGLRSSA